MLETLWASENFHCALFVYGVLSLIIGVTTLIGNETSLSDYSKGQIAFLFLIGSTGWILFGIIFGIMFLCFKFWELLGRID